MATDTKYNYMPTVAEELEKRVDILEERLSKLVPDNEIKRTINPIREKIFNLVHSDEFFWATALSRCGMIEKLVREILEAQVK